MLSFCINLCVCNQDEQNKNNKMNKYVIACHECISGRMCMRVRLNLLVYPCILLCLYAPDRCLFVWLCIGILWVFFPRHLSLSEVNFCICQLIIFNIYFLLKRKLWVSLGLLVSFPQTVFLIVSFQRCIWRSPARTTTTPSKSTTIWTAPCREPTTTTSNGTTTRLVVRQPAGTSRWQVWATRAVAARPGIFRPAPKSAGPFM